MYIYLKERKKRDQIPYKQLYLQKDIFIRKTPE